MRALVSITLLFACSSAAEPPASTSPEPAGDETAARSEGVTPPTSPTSPTSEAPAERREVAAPIAGAIAKPPAIGQWVRYGVTFREGGRSTVEYRIIDREDDSWWVEVTDRRRNRVRHVRMRVRPGAEGSRELLALAFKNGPDVEEIPERLLGNYAPMLDQWLGMMFPTELEGPQEDVTVPAGVFHGASKGEQTLRFMDRQVSADVWRHPEVPLTAMVKFVDRAAEGHTLELLGWGDEGARSAF